MEYTFGMIKSSACYAYAMNDIIDRIEKAGLTVARAETRELWPSEIRELYGEHLGKPYWDDLATSVDGRVFCMLLKGEDAVAKWRALMGATDPKKAAPGTIRHAYGLKVGPMADNAVHGSDSITSATREIALIFPDEKLEF